MKFEPYINDLLDPKIKNFEDLTNHFDLVERFQKSFYFKLENYDDDEDNILTNASLPLTEISVELFEKALEELNCSSSHSKSGKQKKLNLKYATRLSRKSMSSPYCVILSLIYIKRLKEINPAYVKSQSACDLFLISLIVSSKFLYEDTTDEQIYNTEWSTISGIDIKTLNQMEIDFLFKLNWQAYVGPLEFMEQWIHCENLVIKNEFKKRSYQFITYNEIMRLFENDKLVYQQLISNLLKFVSKFFLLASFTYSSIILGLVLLSESTMLHNSLQHNAIQSPINQTYYYEDYRHDVTEDSQSNDEQTTNNEQSIENLELNSKALNLNKLNTLDLNELNNKLSTLSREDDVIGGGLIIEMYNIEQLKANDHSRCKLVNKFSHLIATLSNQPVTRTENHSDYKSFKKQSIRSTPSTILPYHSRSFLEYRVY